MLKFSNSKLFRQSCLRRKVLYCLIAICLLFLYNQLKFLPQLDVLRNQHAAHESFNKSLEELEMAGIFNSAIAELEVNDHFKSYKVQNHPDTDNVNKHADNDEVINQGDMKKGNIHLDSDKVNSSDKGNNSQDSDKVINQQNYNKVDNHFDIIDIKKVNNDLESGNLNGNLDDEKVNINPETDKVDIHKDNDKREEPEDSIVIDDQKLVEEKRKYIKQMMQHAWGNYKRYAWGENELKPIGKTGNDDSILGSSLMGASIVDSLDTLFLMNLTSEFDSATLWIKDNFNMDSMESDLSVFETTIRFVGGLLSAFALSGNPVFKDKAADVADKLLPAFNSASGIPYSLVHSKTGLAQNFKWVPGRPSILSEFGTLEMEFSYLSHVTGNPKYREKVARIREIIKTAYRPGPLYPTLMNPVTGEWAGGLITLGSMADSFYEYLLKEWIRTGDPEAGQLFEAAAVAIDKELVKQSDSGLLYLSEVDSGRVRDKMDHLSCFTGGMFALAAQTMRGIHNERWMELGEELTRTCHYSYSQTETNLGPDIMWFKNGQDAVARTGEESKYILRPETVESYFYLWRITKNPVYRAWGWEVVEALEAHCRTTTGYVGLSNVYQVDSPKDDVQQSFFLAETLKYLFLLFSDDHILDLNHWVLNTEAHPLPILR